MSKKEETVIRCLQLCDFNVKRDEGRSRSLRTLLHFLLDHLRQLRDRRAQSVQQLR